MPGAVWLVYKNTDMNLQIVMGSGLKIFDPGQVNFLLLGWGQPFMVWVGKIIP